MREVNIYIDVYHSGHLKYGTGTYNLLLEYITDKGLVTKRVHGGIKRTTANRTAVAACITALEQIVLPCDIKIVINSEYVTQAINTNEWFKWLNTGKNAKGKPAKNMDLWKQLFELVDKYHVTFEYAKSNQYTLCMISMAKNVKIEFKEDEGNV
jgi:ribonuclease HI